MEERGQTAAIMKPVMGGLNLGDLGGKKDGTQVSMAFGNKPVPDQPPTI